MHKRPEYKVLLTPEGEKIFGSGTHLSVFADEINLTGSGEMVFGQVRDATVFDETGTQRQGKTLATVLVLGKDMFCAVIQVNKDGGDLYKESGVIVTSLKH